MKFREAYAELELAAVYIDCPVGFLLALHRVFRQAFGIDAEEVAHTGFLQFQIPSYTVKAHYVDNVLLYRTENPLQHIIEVYAYVGGNATTLVYIAFP